MKFTLPTSPLYDSVELVRDEPKAIIDVFSDMSMLTPEHRLAALQVWRSMPLRPAFAYGSSDIADKLGFGSGCWVVEGSVPQKPVNGRGYLTKAEAYSAAGILAHVILAKDAVQS